MWITQSRTLLTYTDDAMLCMHFLTHQLCTCRSFVSALLGQLPKLGSLLAASESSSSSYTNINRTKTVFLQLLGRLLKLDSQLVLDPTQPTFHFMLDSYFRILDLRYLHLHTVCFCCSCVEFCHSTDLFATIFNALMLTPMLLITYMPQLGILADVSKDNAICMT